MQNQFVIRPIQQTDINKLYSLLWGETSPHRTEQLLFRAIENTKCRRGVALVAEFQEYSSIAGFGQLVPWKHYAEITDLFVDINWRRQGIGTQIITQLLNYAHLYQFPFLEIGAELSNEDAIRLYRRLKFTDHEIKEINHTPYLYLRCSLV
jgi:ribosomal protein S18 acetylase RimI-like enzyme